MEPGEQGTPSNSLQYWDQLLMLLISMIEEDQKVYAPYLNQCARV